MHYLQEGPFQGHIERDEPEGIGETFAKLAGMYQPIQGLTLKTAEIRKLNKAIDVLEAEPEGGYFALEDEDFKVLGKVLIAFAESSNLARSAPFIEDILEAVLTEKPSASKVTDIKEAAGD